MQRICGRSIIHARLSVSRVRKGLFQVHRNPRQIVYGPLYIHCRLSSHHPPQPFSLFAHPTHRRIYKVSKVEEDGLSGRQVSLSLPTREIFAEGRAIAVKSGRDENFLIPSLFQFPDKRGQLCRDWPRHRLSFSHEPLIYVHVITK